ncbi:MAG: hypothetical protein LBG78_00295, partial [Azoarcus sp.]|jgi:RNase P protein component|nr:hypothetical protein [Azoarcus sp.]
LTKRIVRESFRRERCHIPACDLVARLHAPITTVCRAALHLDVRQLLGRLSGVLSTVSAEMRDVPSQL